MQCSLYHARPRDPRSRCQTAALDHWHSRRHAHRARLKHGSPPVRPAVCLSILDMLIASQPPGARRQWFNPYSLQRKAGRLGRE